MEIQVSWVFLPFTLGERSEPHIGVFNRDFAWYIYIYVCRGPKCVSGITWAKHAHAQSQFGAVKTDPWNPCYSLQLYARAALAGTKKKRSLRNEKLKANRASVTEEQRKEMLRIRHENKKTENHENSACPLSNDGSEVTTMSWRAT